jgi:hypothetical protein
MQSSEMTKNPSKDSKESEYQLTLVNLLNNPLKANKAIGLYSITEDYFEQDVNSVFFCKNSEFIETGET